MHDEPENMTTEQLWEALGEATGFRRGDILMHLSRDLTMECKHVEAQVCAEEAMATFEKAGFPREHAYALRQIAHILQHQGQFTEAIERFQEVLPLLEELGSDMDVAMTYDNMADATREHNNYEQAAEWYELAEQHYLSGHEGAESAIWAGRSYASCLSLIGARDDEMLMTLIRIVDGAKGILKIHQVNELREQLIYAYLRSDMFDEAMVEAKSRLAVANTCGCAMCVPSALIDLGYVQERMGFDDSALTNHQEAYSIAKEKNLPLLQAHAMVHFGYKLMASDPEKARDYFLQAEAIFDSLGNAHGTKNMKRLFAFLAREEGKFEQALSFLKEELELRTWGKDLRGAGVCQQYMARTYLALGRPRNALQELASNGWVDREGPITSKDVAKHKALHAEALLADGQIDAALNRSAQLLNDMDPEKWFDVLGIAHEVRAYALRHRDPMGSERAAGRALACFTVAGDETRAKTISQEFFIQPYLTLAKIDVDNQLRAEAHEAEMRIRAEAENVHFLEIVARDALPDPIEQEVEDAQIRQIRPEGTGEGIA